MDNYAYGGPLSSSSPQNQRTRPSNCFSHCFRGGDAAPVLEDSAVDADPSSPIRCPSSWPPSKAHERPGLKRKHHRSLLHRVGTPRRPAAGVFKYDPLSYARNFDEGHDFHVDGEISPTELRFRSFSPRPPSTPPQPAPAAAEEEAACNNSLLI